MSTAASRVEGLLREIQTVLLGQLAVLNAEEDTHVEEVLRFNKAEEVSADMAASLVQQFTDPNEAAQALSLYESVTMAVMMIGEGLMAPSTFCRAGTAWNDKSHMRCSETPPCSVATAVLSTLSPVTMSDLSWSWKMPVPGTGTEIACGDAESKLKSAMLVGSEACGAHFTHHNVNLCLRFLEKGACSPVFQHSVQEWYFPLCGGLSATWRKGSTTIDASVSGGFILYKPGDIRSFAAGPEEDLLCLHYCSLA